MYFIEQSVTNQSIPPPDIHDLSDTESDKTEEMVYAYLSDHEEWIHEIDSDSSSDTSDDDEALIDLEGDMFYMCELSKLLELIKFCPRCGQPVKGITGKSVGSMLILSIMCKSECNFQWSSQTFFKDTKMPKGNINFVASTLVTGNTFSTIDEITEVANIKFLSKQTFYNIQKKYIEPKVEAMYNVLHKDVLDAFSEHEHKVILGDGR